MLPLMRTALNHYIGEEKAGKYIEMLESGQIFIFQMEGETPYVSVPDGFLTDEQIGTLQKFYVSQGGKMLLGFPVTETKLREIARDMFITAHIMSRQGPK